MRRLMAALLAVHLLGTSATPVIAQELSSPPWFGGRVEMPEHGFAVTIPEDWVAFDLAVDAASQLEAGIGVHRPGPWFADDATLAGGLAAMGSSGMHLLSIHETSFDHCLWTAVPVSTMPAGVAADEQYKTAIDDVLWDAEPPQAIDLPAGPAYLLRQSMWREPPGVWAQATSYVLDMGEGVFFAVCTTHDTRPDDDWLAIAETIEFLPAEE